MCLILHQALSIAARALNQRHLVLKGELIGTEVLINCQSDSGVKKRAKLCI